MLLSNMLPKPSVMLPKITSVFCSILISCFVLSESQRIDLRSSSSSDPPVTFYRLKNAFGETESAVSLGGAPVGLYSKRVWNQIPFAFPLLYGIPLSYFPAVRPQYTPPLRKLPYTVPPLLRPTTPRPSRPSISYPRGEHGVSPRVLGGLLGGNPVGALVGGAVGGLTGGAVGGAVGGLLGGLG